MANGEILFYCGIAAVTGAVALGIAAIITFKIRSTKLNRQLTQEYGPRKLR